MGLPGVPRPLRRLATGYGADRLIACLGELQGRTVDPRAALPSLLQTIALWLQVPYVAVALADGANRQALVEHGTKDGSRVEEFAMLAQGKEVGRLLVGTRGFGGRLTRRERRLLDGVAQYTAAVTEAGQLVRDLQRSRERLITVREEERRRLRRDLHDGIGPALTGVAMQVRAARKAQDDPQRLSILLDGMTADLRACAIEVRQLLDDLHRPGELDDGLAAALRAQCQRFDGGSMTIDLRVGDGVERLPAAIEVAAYRIVSEALANVARHARARTCEVTVDLDRDGALTIEVVDDGIGLPPDGNRHGVGLDSMRERAAELGGECVVASNVPRGTTVRVRLPWTWRGARHD